MMKRMKQKMSEFDNFKDYRNDLLKRLAKREPKIDTNFLERVDPLDYIFNPIQEISFDKIDNMPENTSVTKEGLETFAKMKQEPLNGAFHGVRLGKEIDIPIAVVDNDNGTYSIVDGFHRAVQVFINDDKTIWAFVEGGSGDTLREIFNTLGE
jgi:hypothetical protein